MLFTAFAGLSIILLGLHFLTGSSTTGSSILEGVSFEEFRAEPLGDEPVATETTFKLTERQKFDLVLTVLKLKALNKAEQKLQYAEKITKATKLVDDSGDTGITAGWTAVTACLESDSCTDEFYVFMKTVFDAGKGKSEKSFFSWRQKENPLEELAIHLLDLKLAAEKNNVIIRSKLVTETNALVNNNGSLEIKELWDDLVTCDFVCPVFDQLLLAVMEHYFER